MSKSLPAKTKLQATEYNQVSFEKITFICPDITGLLSRSQYQQRFSRYQQYVFESAR